MDIQLIFDGAVIALLVVNTVAQFRKPKPVVVPAPTVHVATPPAPAPIQDPKGSIPATSIVPVTKTIAPTVIRPEVAHEHDGRPSNIWSPR